MPEVNDRPVNDTEPEHDSLPPPLKTSVHDTETIRSIKGFVAFFSKFCAYAAPDAKIRARLGLRLVGGHKTHKSTHRKNYPSSTRAGKKGPPIRRAFLFLFWLKADG
jgi:hypothetical protein